MYQKITLIGNLGQDPEMRYMSDGSPVTSFSVAVNRVWNDQNGQQQKRTTWFRVTAWRRLAETCNQYLSKGRQVYIEGEMREPKPWQGRDGEWRASLDVTAQVVKFLGGRSDAESSGGFGGPSDPSGPSQGGGTPTEFVDEEEIPF